MPEVGRVLRSLLSLLLVAVTVSACGSTAHSPSLIGMAQNGDRVIFLIPRCGTTISRESVFDISDDEYETEASHLETEPERLFTKFGQRMEPLQLVSGMSSDTVEAQTFRDPGSVETLPPGVRTGVIYFESNGSYFSARLPSDAEVERATGADLPQYPHVLMLPQGNGTANVQEDAFLDAGCD